jgi:pimeloyl-ACP methyl ester carboxylesterase
LERETVILIHGLWMNGLDQLVLARRLRTRGFRCVHFRYPSVRRTPAENAVKLETFVRKQALDRVHFVAHSLGGIVLMDLFERWPEAPPGRSILLSSPLLGNAAARRMVANRWLSLPLGRSVERGVLGGGPAVPVGREVGMLAGSREIGAGRIIGGLPRPNDGTVAVAETHAPGLADHAVWPTSHFGLQISSGACRLIARFLETGRFGEAASPGGAPVRE